MFTVTPCFLYSLQIVLCPFGNMIGCKPYSYERHTQTVAITVSGGFEGSFYPYGFTFFQACLFTINKYI